MAFYLTALRAISQGERRTHVLKKRSVFVAKLKHFTSISKLMTIFFTIFAKH